MNDKNKNAHQSRFFKAPLVRQEDGQLKSVWKNAELAEDYILVLLLTCVIFQFQYNCQFYSDASVIFDGKFSSCKYCNWK